ncbi:retrovirus-related Pol polyprotein from transposon TNT 1-94, partial [Trifolium pratense]
MVTKFDYVVCSIVESNDVTTMSIDELQSSPIVHEGRMKKPSAKQHVNTEEQALKVSQGRGSGSGRGRGRNSNRGRGRGRQNKEMIECYNCHKLGHYQSECPDWEGNANYAEFYD